MPGRSSGFRWLLALLGLVARRLAALAAAAAWHWIDRPLPLAGAHAELSIEAGATPREVAQAWVDAGVQTSPRLLYEYFRWSGQARRIRAGSYEIEPGTTPRRLLDKMVQGDETLEQLRFVEGWTRAPVARRTGARAAPAATPPPP